jgi:hypothetical protein
VGPLKFKSEVQWMSRQRDLGGAVRSSAAEGSPPVKRNLHALSAPDLRRMADDCPDEDPRLVHPVHCGLLGQA